MKAKYYIGILSFLILSTSAVTAGKNDQGGYRNDGAGMVINNYYDNDFTFASRINRFHRSYAAFDYYSPVFTKSYLYHRPFSFGLNFFGGLGFGLGFSYNYPAYDYGYDYGYGDYYGYDPYYGSNYYWDYNPFWYNRWCFPFMFSFNFGNIWRNNYYGWNGYRHNYIYNDYRYNSNYSRGYNSGRYSSPGYTSRRNPGNSSETSTHNNNVSRRDNSSTYSNRNEFNSSRPVVRSDNGFSNGEMRRTITPEVNRRQISSNGNAGRIRNTNSSYLNNNSMVPNSGNLSSGLSNNRLNNNFNHQRINTRSVYASRGTTANFSRSGNMSLARSVSSGSRSSGSARSISSHSGSRSSGSRSGSSHSGSRSSGRR
jgi:hypothetical protein